MFQTSWFRNLFRSSLLDHLPILENEKRTVYFNPLLKVYVSNKCTKAFGSARMYVLACSILYDNKKELTCLVFIDLCTYVLFVGLWAVLREQRIGNLVIDSQRSFQLQGVFSMVILSSRHCSKCNRTALCRNEVDKSLFCTLRMVVK